MNRRAVLTLPRTGKPHPVLLLNISTTGACVHTDIPLALGDDVRLRIDISRESMVTLNAIVARVRPRSALFSEYGLRIIKPDAGARAALDAFVRRFAG